MNSEKKTARIVGVLFLLALASVMLNGLLLGALTEPDYLAAFSATENEVLIAVLLEFTLIVSVVSIPIMMFPIFKKHNESLALGYVGARIFEGFSDFILAISWLLLVTLGNESVKAGAPAPSFFQASGALLVGLYDWVGVLENIPYCLGALIFYYLLYQSKLVPRWLSAWGLIGATLLLTRVPLSWFVFDPLSTSLLAIPIIMNEVVLAVWLIVKGFESPVFASE
ncbi:MAG: DUF4386 domain-containing protein [Candidatus Hodarchaeales archaeon]|jgi:hypothetical protein